MTDRTKVPQSNVLPSPCLGAQKLNKWRSSNKLSLRKVAKTYRVSATQVSRMERSMIWPSFELALEFERDGICELGDWGVPAKHGEHARAAVSDAA